MRRPIQLLLSTALVLALPACKTGPDLSADYAQTARENYELAIGEFTDKDWEESIQYADFVRIRFPFSRYAVEAELLIARAEFEQGNYITAQDAFRQFAKLHPTHEHTRNGWASFMAAASAFMNAPKGFFLLPASEQRDQTPLREAMSELRYYFDHYTGSITEGNAVKLRDEVKRRLLQHELYVADFYLDRDRPEAAIGRLETAHDTYPGIGLDAEVLFLLGVTYLRMDEVELARNTFTELQTQHPRHHHGKQARIYLKYIYDTYGASDPNRRRPDRSPPVPKAPKEPRNLESPARPERKAPQKPEGTTPPPSSKSSAPAVKTPAKAKTPESKSPEAKSPESSTPEASTPEAKAPESKTPEASTPESKAPESKAPESSTPESSGGAAGGESTPPTRSP